MKKIGLGTSSFSDLSDLSTNRYPLGFMDLLGAHQDHTTLYNTLIHAPPMHLAATHNSSSIPLTSSEAVTRKEKKLHNEKEEQEDGEGDQQQQQQQEDKRKKRFKSTKSITNQMKISVPRVSFITKSDVDHLDDGYKWRKYGQKPVRNSPFPRNYYRCTVSWCGVKKRVERSFSDPSNVITTYEGQHTHPSPHMIISKNSNFGGSNIGSPSSQPHHFFDLPTLPLQLCQLYHQQQQQQQQHQELSIFGTEYLNTQANQEQELSFSGTKYLRKQENGFLDDCDNDDHVMKKSRTRDFLDGAGLVKDHGLLQDVVSSHMVKENC